MPKHVDAKTPEFTRAALEAAIEVAITQSTAHLTDVALAKAQVGIRNAVERLLDFHYHHGRLPNNLGEIAKLKLSNMTRFITVTNDTPTAQEQEGYPNVVKNWTMSDFFKHTAYFDDAQLGRVPSIGYATIALFNFIHLLAQIRPA